ncbi:non-ribosomal peptide synthetase [Nocardia sp. CY41]|uniref:non-ribosomal peptide synthetase n=1 Tax=Nocardia sp. CY41 TaxID=2608686 RepID=UPI00135C4365|nr:non-ribosomal peptide synthetase [Nocardia sp. CY41]
MAEHNSSFAYPLTVQQEAVWLSQQLNPDKPFNIGGYLDIHGEVDPEAIIEAFRRAIAEAPTLLVNIKAGHGEPRQYRRELGSWKPAVTDYSLLVDGESRARTLTDQLVREPFDLEKGFLFRAELIKISEDRSFLCFVAHHVVADGASCMIIGHRVAQLYSAILGGAAVERPRYLDLEGVRDEIERYRDSAGFQRDRAFWSEYIDRTVEPLRPARQASPCDGPTIHHRMDMPSYRLRRLAEVSTALNVPLPAVLTAATSLAFRTFARTNDFYVQFPVANRVGRARWTPCLIANALPLRVTLEPDRRFSELCSDVAATIQLVLRHSKYDTTDIRRDLGATDKTGDLFGPAVNVIPFLASVPIGSGRAEFRPLPELPASELSIMFSYDVDQGTDALIGIAADSRLYSIDDLHKYMEAISSCLHQVVTDPAVRLADIEVMDPAERGRVLTEWNTTTATIPVDPRTTMVDQFQAAVAAAPEAVAVIDGATSYTYRQLNTRANTLARTLIDTGVGPDRVVAVAVDRSFDLVAALLAVLKAGGAYLPIDPTYPTERLTYILTDADPTALLTTHTLHPLLPDTSIPTLHLDTTHTHDVTDLDLDTPDVTDLERRAPLHPNHLAYVIYTSGSTGRPKPVATTHRNVVGLFAATVPQFGFDATDVWAWVHSPAFDFSVWELWGGLLHGGSVVVVPREVSRSPLELWELLATHGVTVLNQTPSAFYIDHLRVTGSHAVDTIVFIGEALTPPVIERTRDVFPGIRVINGYGPTETTVYVTAHEVGGGGVVSVPIGRPIGNARVWVLDSWLRPVPVGVAGELYIAGAGLARGYRGRAGSTAARFVADPYSPAGERMYRSGDLARWNDRGELEFLGRVDDQVKIRGFRVEPGEVEAVLATHPGIARAVVVARELPGGDKQLIGYAVPHTHTDHTDGVAGGGVAVDGVAGGGDVVDAVAVRGFLAARLPEFMVPAAVVVVDRLPLTANGKLDRGALPDPVFTGGGAHREPRNAEERALAAIFAEVLRLDRVGIDDSFFDLGGHSILAIEVVSRAKQQGITCTLLQVFEHRTVAALAAAVDAAGTRVTLDEPPGGGVGDLPLPPNVHYMLQRGGNYDRFAQTRVLELPVGIERSQIVAVLTAAVDHHDMLRARLLADGENGPCIVVGPPGSVDVDALVHRIEFDTIEPIELHEFAMTELDTAANRLDPANGTVLQFIWLDPVGAAGARTGAGRLIVLAHHLVIDGVSWRILVPDLVAAWAQVSAGNTPVLAETGTSMRRWAHALIEEAHSERRHAESAYWHDVLAEPDPLIGGRELDPAIDNTGTLRIVEREVSTEVTTALLTTLPGLFQGSVNDTLLATLALALVRWRDTEPTALLRLEGHGRQEEVVPGVDLSRTIGWFTSIYPVRLDLAGIDLDDALSGGPALGDAIRAVKHQLLAVPDKGIGFGLLRYLDPETARQFPKRLPGRVGFNYLGRYSAGDIPAEPEGLGWLPTDDLGDVHVREHPDVPLQSAIDVNAVVIGDRLRASFGFPATLLTDDEVAELADLWIETLGAAARFTQTSAARTAAEEEATATAPLAPPAAGGLGLDVVLPIRLGGDEPALFCIHPQSGMAWTYLGFADALAPGRPIYGLQAPELSGHEPSPRSIEEFADRYVREIRALQPEGPYHVLGWSFGGLIAHTAATKLKAEGAEVGVIALLDADTADIDGDSIEPLTVGSFINTFGSVFGIHDVPAEVTVQQAADLIRERLGGVSLLDAATLERMVGAYNAATRTRTGYRRPMFDGDIVYFSATVDTSDIFGPDGWRPYVTGEITNHDIEATHTELTAPHVLPVIARVLDAHLGGRARSLTDPQRSTEDNPDGRVG